MSTRISITPTLFLLLALMLAAPAARAQAVDEKALPNFYRVDDNYFRGGQPSEAGLRQLAEMGIKVIVDLRGQAGERDEKEQHLAEALGMRYVNLTISTFRAPDEEQIGRFMELLRDRENLPVFVHCMRGNDRTGLATGLYRVEFYDWTGEQAYREMKERGFSFSLLRRGMKDYIFKYAKRKMERNKQGDSALN